MNVLVVGSAQCVWDDLKAANAFQIDAIIAVNRMIRDFPLEPFDLTYGASVHPEKALGFRREGVPFVSTKPAEGVDIIYDQRPHRSGTSGLYATGLALFIGARRVILAGIPVDETPHYYPGEGLGSDLAVYRAPWQQLAQTLKGRVFSLSGWTRDLLGSPL